MIAPTRIPESYREWNRRHGAPFGSRCYRAAQSLPRGRRFLEERLFRAAPSLAGPFAVQPNNATRAYEYPWTFEALGVEPGMRILEIGGGLSGLQFVLSRAGAEVVNVDPGMEAHGRGWPVDDASITRMNRAFGAKVHLKNTFLQNAGLEPGSFDRAVSVSTIEHIPAGELPGMMGLVADLLKPGGRFVATVDLFINLKPFTHRTENEFGGNISVADLIEGPGLDLVHGDKRELYGYPEFDAERIQSRLEEYLLGTYPALIQTVIAQKPNGAG